MAYIDLTGQTFNLLTVREFSHKHTKTGAIHWHCVCKCGNTTIASTQSLRENKSKSCGCLRRRQGEASPQHIPIEERFWPKVKKTSKCWIWTASCDSKGYGTIHYANENRAHRVSWVLHKGLIPHGLQVLHKCDNPPCIRPSHLFLGTNDDNVKDKLNKGRGRAATGEQQGSSKLTSAQVCEIRIRAASGTRGIYRKLAKEYGVHPSNISVIMRGKGWKD